MMDLEEPMDWDCDSPQSSECDEELYEDYYEREEECEGAGCQDGRGVLPTTPRSFALCTVGIVVGVVCLLGLNHSTVERRRSLPVPSMEPEGSVGDKGFILTLKAPQGGAGAHMKGLSSLQVNLTSLGAWILLAISLYTIFCWGADVVLGYRSKDQVVALGLLILSGLLVGYMGFLVLNALLVPGPETYSDFFGSYSPLGSVGMSVYVLEWIGLVIFDLSLRHVARWRFPSNYRLLCNSEQTKLFPLPIFLALGEESCRALTLVTLWEGRQIVALLIAAAMICGARTPGIWKQFRSNAVGEMSVRSRRGRVGRRLLEVGVFGLLSGFWWLHFGLLMPLFCSGMWAALEVIHNPQTQGAGRKLGKRRKKPASATPLLDKIEKAEAGEDI